MGKRKLLPVAEFPMVGGALCLDLANTTGARRSGLARERLCAFDDLVTWSLRAGLVRPAQAKRLRARGRLRRATASAALGRARELRELIYDLFRAIAEGSEPPARSVAGLTEWWRAERSRREIAYVDGGFELRLEPRSDELDAMLWPIVASAVDLLTSSSLAHVKRCGECDWLFVDESKNGSRTWCKDTCGDRARARRFYARHHRQDADPRAR